MADDYRRHGRQRYHGIEKWDETAFGDYLEKTRRDALGLDMPPGRVCSFSYVLIDGGGEIVAGVRIRPVLSAQLEHHGGNIGFDVPPSKRGRGYGTEALRQATQKAKEFGLVSALITCDEKNIASKRVIENNRGVLIENVKSERTAEVICRYRIDLTDQ